MGIAKEDILRRLSAIKDPRGESDIVTSGRVRHVAVCDGYATIRISSAGIAREAGDVLAQTVSQDVESLGPEIRQVRVELTDATPAAPSAPPSPTKPVQPPASAPQGLPEVRRIIAVGAGKGGVGKSTVSVNLAVGLARRGQRVGLLDADIYGPSAPTLLGLDDLPLEGSKQTLYPFAVHGLKAMTIGKLVDADKPLIWRGPMAHSAFRQLALQTEWGALDYLIVDLPPGTGDVPLTMSQMLAITGAVIVCTPQKVAQDDAVRAAGMFKQLNIPLLGVVENMSYFVGDDGKEYDLFGRGGAAAMAGRLGLPVLGTIPIHMELRANSDAGNPTANFTGNPALAAELDSLAKRVEEEIQMHSADQPSLTIH